MKKLGLVFLVLILAGSFSETAAQKKGRAVVCFQSDMDCTNCEQTLYEYLKFEKGVKDLKVDHASNTIFIEYAEKKNDDKSIAQAIEKKGYKAQKITKKEYDELVEHSKEHGHEHGHEVHRER
ncbi:Heavy-metal-associated domain-containing protein [Mariniphaga anaerophila]|uniref:Heavy-metal-associated domain-containing protein n=1 Tax=Mariniphaga anaerophila TaxID=1484053 RepID=A0A1M4SXM6_9BACT|nr:cation transporter [Mariniphaga anaerophila]SHE36974.1 Heavy-metal-associated domain-containing protein [Mariniphaga anaerophila]